MTAAGDDVRRLLDLEAIRALKHAYFRCLDTKDWDGVEACFVPEATATYPTRSCGSRDEIRAFLAGSITPDLVTVHHGHHPEIELSGDEATGTWHLHDKVFAPAHGFALEGAAIYTDRYVRTADGWRMSHTGYERLYESTWSTAGITGFRLEQGAVSRGPAPA